MSNLKMPNLEVPKLGVLEGETYVPISISGSASATHIFCI